MAVVDPTTREIIWNKCQRHETKQPEYVRDMLTDMRCAAARIARARPRS
jgi:hypothetical protein